MEGEMFEIRWHGRGGQGAKTASELLAKAAIERGKYIQSLPEFGAERQGAPVQAFTRISNKPILLHTAITKPDMVIVVDETLLKSIPVTDGLKEKDILLVNTSSKAKDIKKIIDFKGHIFTVDATQIAIDEIGKPIPNAAMLGAV
ncbi:MAG: 2-oxoacid:acceptor oxidoreductase family protein, partial [archaeon]